MILELLENSFFQRALTAALVIGFANGFFSGFVVLRKHALSVSALSHTMLPGITLGIIVAGVLTQASAFFGALFAALMVGLGSVAVARGRRVAQGTALAVLYTTAFAAGVAILPRLNTRQELEHWLFGDILAVGRVDLWTAFGIAALTLLTVNLLMRPLLLTLFEPNVAAAQGVPVRRMHYLVFTLLALSLVASLQAVGCVLSVGLLVAPAATISLFTDRTQWLFWGGGLLGAIGAISGVMLGAIWNFSAGPMIVMVLGGFFLVSWILSPKYGLIATRHG